MITPEILKKQSSASASPMGGSRNIYNLRKKRKGGSGFFSGLKPVECLLTERLNEQT
ncbi:MAG: hypothetical protein SPL30_01615 [Succinivibrio sp.]|nr:hypothetical protein [Succinivibrio sp.]